MLAAPAAVLMTAPQAQAAPMFVAPQQFPEFPGLDFFGSGGLSAALLDPVFDFAGLIPGLNIFVGNGVDGTATNINGGDAGLLFGNGGNGFSRTIPGTGNGGQLLGFDVDPLTGALTQDAALTYGSAGFNYVTFNAAGTYAYLSNAWDVTISIASVDATTGRLTTIPGGHFGVGTRPDNIAVMQR